jgi:hypothetical protein
MNAFQPPHETISVYVGVNDWGISVINRLTLKRMEAMEIDKVDLQYEPNRNFVEVHRRKHETLIFNTPQVSPKCNNRAQSGLKTFLLSKKWREQTASPLTSGIRLPPRPLYYIDKNTG